MRFVAGITLYNPTESQLEKIKKYTDSFEYVFLFNNTEQGKNVNLHFDDPRIKVLGDGSNHGLPYAFNKILEHDECRNADFLCTLDQDSFYSFENIARMKLFLENMCDLHHVGIVGPYVDYGDGGKKIYNQSYRKQPWVITSGSFLNLHLLYSESVRYDEKYFIDKFEIDLCKQLARKGYEILMYQGSVLVQALGEESGHRHPNHSALRHYYLFRNRFYFNRKWFTPVKRLVLNSLQTVKHIGLIVLYEERKANKVLMLKEAAKDYFANRMGKKCI